MSTLARFAFASRYMARAVKDAPANRIIATRILSGFMTLPPLSAPSVAAKCATRWPSKSPSGAKWRPAFQGKASGVPVAGAPRGGEMQAVRQEGLARFEALSLSPLITWGE